jgi:hypothetical protein
MSKLKKSLQPVVLATKVLHLMFAKRIHLLLQEPNLTPTKQNIYQTVLQLTDKLSESKLKSQYLILSTQAAQLHGNAKELVQQQSDAYLTLLQWWKRYYAEVSFIWNLPNSTVN